MGSMEHQSDPTDDTVILYTSPPADSTLGLDAETAQFVPLDPTAQTAQTAPTAPTAQFGQVSEGPDYWEERYRHERSRKRLFLGTTIGAGLLAVGLGVVAFATNSGQTWASDAPAAAPTSPAASGQDGSGQTDGLATDPGLNDGVPKTAPADPQVPNGDDLGQLDPLTANSPQLRHLLRDLMSGRHDPDALLDRAVSRGLLTSDQADQLRQYFSASAFPDGSSGTDQSGGSAAGSDDGNADQT